MEQKFTEFGKKDCTLAFQNVRVTDEEKAMLAEKRLPFPRPIYWRGPDDFFGKSMSSWTANHKNGYYLRNYGCDWQEPEKKGYILVWKEFKEDALISVILEDHVRYNEDHRMVVAWDMQSIDIPLALTRQRDEILKVLKEALFAYGPTGDPDFNYSPDWDKFIIMFNF